MARIILNAEIGNLSGTIGNMTFKTMNGKTFVQSKSEPRLPQNATVKQKAQFKKRIIVDACVSFAQKQMGDLVEAIKQRKKLRDRMSYLYDKLSPEIKVRTKLQKAIMTAYWQGQQG